MGGERKLLQKMLSNLDQVDCASSIRYQIIDAFDDVSASVRCQQQGINCPSGIRRQRYIQCVVVTAGTRSHGELNIGSADL